MKMLYRLGMIDRACPPCGGINYEWSHSTKLVFERRGTAPRSVARTGQAFSDTVNHIDGAEAIMRVEAER